LSEKVQQQKLGGGVFVFLEQTGGHLEDVSLEALGKAREIADGLGVKVTGVLLGDEGIGSAAEECTKRSANTVLLGESNLLKDFTTEAYSKVISQILKDRDPDIFLVGATHNGTSLAGSLAIKAGVGLLAHVVDLEIEKDSGKLLGSVPGFGGNIVAVCKCTKGRPQMATVRPGIFKPLDAVSSAGLVEKLDLASLKPEDVKCRIVEKSVGKGIEITHAERAIVAGLGCKSDLSIANKLADPLHAIVAFSRPVADKGMAPKDLVVGSTGSSLNAKLAVILGVSGAAHFVSGIRDVKTVIAINSDPEAQIFSRADYCVTGDVYKIIPELVAELSSEAK
jgi:electron transfer flavoprotein alpha subunit